MALKLVWPPETLTIRTEDIIDQCELMEAHPPSAEGKPFVPVVEMAALLYSGEYIHARHTWRRWKPSNPPSFLADWWSVGAAMMALSCGSSGAGGLVSELATTIWQGLAHIQLTHPSPLNNYASEVGDAFRKQVLLLSPRYPPPQPYWNLLNFSTASELEQFCQKHSFDQRASRRPKTTSGLSLDGKTQLTQVVAYLESKSPLASVSGCGPPRA